MTDRQPGTVYRIDIKWPEGAIWAKTETRNRWIPKPRGPGSRPTESLAAARALLTRLRNNTSRTPEDMRPEYRIVRLSGEWEPLEP